MLIRFFLSLLYGSAIYIRNKMYDCQIFKSQVNPHQQILISIGNITVGGTGKTPHIEYLLRLLAQSKKSIGVVSRGYKRKSKGFLWVDTNNSSEQVGDEPLQIKRKFPDTIVAVSIQREFALAQIAQRYPECKIVLLDDAYQYRKLIPQCQAVLIDFNRPVWTDHLLPWGNLRDTMLQLHRANVLIVTKCPNNLNEQDKANLKTKLGVQKHQKIFFTCMQYTQPVSVFCAPSKLALGAQVMALAAIAQPNPFFEYVSQQYTLNYQIALADHQHFDQNLLEQLEENALKYDAVITTEKDSVKLLHLKHLLSVNLKQKLFYIPISVKTLDPQFDDFFCDW